MKIKQKLSVCLGMVLMLVMLAGMPVFAENSQMRYVGDGRIQASICIGKQSRIKRDN